ncbi:hypothetical protein CR513_59775, partial [Mucuna pruriens]
MRRAPSLSEFFWFFSLHRSEKVGWSSLSSQLRRKLLKPFYESYKFFKDQFFRVTLREIVPNLLLDSSSELFFPLHWTCQSVVSVTVKKEDLKEWELEFVEELQRLPTLSCVELIKKGDQPSTLLFYTTLEMKVLKKKVASRSPAPIVASSNEANTSSTSTRLPTPPTIVLDSLTNSQAKVVASSSGVAKKHPQEVVDNQERPLRMKVFLKAVAVVGASTSNTEENWRVILASQPSSPSI